MSVGNILAKTVGVIGIGLIGYDSHCAGKMEANAYANNHKAGSLSERFRDDMKLSSPSTVKAGVKKELFDYSLDENLSGFFTSMTGYVKGAGTMILGNILPLGLAVGTLLTCWNKNGKHTLNKMCGIGLAIYGGIFLAQEVFGIGKPKE